MTCGNLYKFITTIRIINKFLHLKIKTGKCCLTIIYKIMHNFEKLSD